jgi:hypothetical protein
MKMFEELSPFALHTSLAYISFPPFPMPSYPRPDRSPIHHKSAQFLRSPTSARKRPYLRQCNTLNLHRHALGQLLNRHTTPRRPMRKVLLIRLVHLLEIRHIRQKHGALDDIRNVAAGLSQDRLDILAAGGGLRGDGARHEGAVGLAGDLARDED